MILFTLLYDGCQDSKLLGFCPKKVAILMWAQLDLACEPRRISGCRFVACRCRFGGAKRQGEIRLRSRARLGLSRQAAFTWRRTFNVSCCGKRRGHLHFVSNHFGGKRGYAGHIRYDNQPLGNTVATVRCLLAG